MRDSIRIVADSIKIVCDSVRIVGLIVKLPVCLLPVRFNKRERSHQSHYLPLLVILLLAQ